MGRRSATAPYLVEYSTRIPYKWARTLTLSSRHSPSSSAVLECRESRGDPILHTLGTLIQVCAVVSTSTPSVRSIGLQKMCFERTKCVVVEYNGRVYSLR